MSLIIVPAAVAVALILVPLLVKLFDRNAGWPLAASFIAVAAYVISHADPILDGKTQQWSVTWIEGLFSGAGGVTLALRMDSLSLFFTLLALLIGAVVFAYSARYLHKGRKILSFYLLMTAFMLAIVLLVLADDVALLFVGWELVSLASFFLIARSGSSGEAGSVRTLLLTFAGGLLLLAGLALAVSVTGTMRISEIIASDAWSGNEVALTATAVLIALAGFSKAAQIPFHFWLPEAMAADTPVSAFLHAAAVVKAGVYLLMRFSGLFQGVLVWNYLLIIVGMTTAIMAAVFAMQKTDLKKLTAYSTVSQLGWIVATIGVGTPYAMAAALVHTAAHALFKSSLFMIAGVVDHQAGSRDIRRLGPLWRRMPFTFTAAVISAASMAAIPPTFGFVSKEGMLDAFLEAPFHSAGIAVLMTAAGLGALATMVYSARYVFGAFIDGPRDTSEVKEAGPLLWISAALPGVLSLPVILVMAKADGPIDSVVAATGVGETHTHLALWHGINTPLLISVSVIAVGAVIIAFRKRLITPLEGRRLGLITGVEIINRTARAAVRAGRLASRPANSTSPSRHVFWILSLLILLGAFSVLGPGRLTGIVDLPPRVTGIDRPQDLIALLVIAPAVLGIISTRSRLASLILLGIVGVGISWMMLMLGAPDVALTNLLVEFCVVVVMMLVIRHQPRLYLREGENRARFSTVLATVVGIGTFFAVYILTGRHDKPELAQWYLENTYDISGGKNVVAVILVEFRAFDTLGELCVLGMAGVVIAAIIKSVPRSPVPGYGPGSTSELFRAEGSTQFPDVHKVPELAPFYSKYLRSTHLNSILTRSTLPIVLPILAVLSLWTFWRGHQSPGGGFLAALVMACGLLYVYVARSRAEPVGGPETGYRLIGVGFVVALGTGVLGFTQGSFLAPLHFYIGSVHISTSLIFDVGVYLAVLGLIVVVINQMGGRERPGADPASFTEAFHKAGSDIAMSRNRPSYRGKLGVKEPAAVESDIRPEDKLPSVAVTVGGSSIALNPTEVSAAQREAARRHREEREAARRPVPTEPAAGTSTETSADTTTEQENS